ncbi:MAG: hypothetical protein KAT26_03320 [Marinosulfonomonas sp.]|nr:hypothetical protein [Marinosulfonomonas sp.]
MRNSAIHVSFAVGISLSPLTGFAGETLPVPNAVFQYLDDADFECSKEQPLRGMIVSPAVPLKGRSRNMWDGVPRKYVTERRGHNRIKIEIAPESADYQNRIGPQITDDAALAIEYSAQVCVGFLGSTVVGGVWSIFGESEKHKFSAKGNFPDPGIQLVHLWQTIDIEFTMREYGGGNKGHYSQKIYAKIYLTEIDVSVVEKTLFQRKFEERFSGRGKQSIGFQPDEPLSNDNTNQPNTSLPIRKE